MFKGQRQPKAKAKSTPPTATPAPTPTPHTPAPPSHIVARQADIAAFAGVSLDAVKNWAKQGMPGKSPRYDLQAIVQWLRREGPWQPRGASDDAALLAAAGDSPAIEKLRSAKAALAELDLQQRRCSLISVESAKDIGLRWALLIKRMGERLGKRYGRDATLAVNETLEECRRVLEDGFAGRSDVDPDAELVDSQRQAADRPPDKPVGRGRGDRPKRAARR